MRRTLDDAVWIWKSNLLGRSPVIATISSLISSIKGTLEGVGPERAEVSVGGVTFQLRVPASVIGQLGEPGNQVRLLTFLQVREDSLTLFGFLTEEARQTFGALTSISGVGPKVALSVLSRFTPESLASAVRAGDVNAIVGVPSVGKKTAGRIILELKGKLESDWAIPSVDRSDDEVIEALTALGYTGSEARRAVSLLPSDFSDSLAERVREVLQHMTSD